MATKIRLKRMGTTNRPFFRLVVADSRFQRDGRFLEALGHYDPLTHPAVIRINEAATVRWMMKGAVLSDTARSLLKKTGILKRFADLKSGAISEAELLENVTVGGTMSTTTALEAAAERRAKKAKAAPAAAPAQAPAVETPAAPPEAAESQAAE